jgi:oligopeptide transport system substrate-binding protein
MNRWSRRAAVAGGGALALAGGYAALRPVPHATRLLHVTPGLFRRGNGAEPDTLDPSLVAATWEDAIVGDLMMGLMTEDAAGKAIPGMAERWETSADGLTWTFHLRPALWSDGTPLTAEDFVFAWRRLVDPKTASSYGYFLDVVRNAAAINGGKLPPEAMGITALDARTLRVALVHPAPYLPQMLTHTSTFPQPRHVVTAKGKDWARVGNHVGNGAYTLHEWVPNGHLTLRKNPRFYDAANVTVEEVVFFPTDDYSAAFKRLRAGELDVQDRMPSQQVDWVKANMPELLHPYPQLSTDFVSANLKVKPFDDIRVRKAMNLVIDREVIAGRILRTGEVPAYGLVPPTTANYPNGPKMRDVYGVPPKARIALARQLMQEAGFGPNRRMRATYLLRSTASGGGRASVAALQQMFGLAYIDITPVPNDAAIFYGRIQSHDFELCQPGWAADFDDASNFLDLFRTGNGNNWGQYSNPAFDAAMDAAQQEADLQARARKLAAAEAILLADHACMPLFFWANSNLVRLYVKGWLANATDKHRTRWVRIDEAARARTLVG